MMETPERVESAYRSSWNGKTPNALRSHRPPTSSPGMLPLQNATNRSWERGEEDNPGVYNESVKEPIKHGFEKRRPSLVKSLRSLFFRVASKHVDEDVTEIGQVSDENENDDVSENEENIDYEITSSRLHNIEGNMTLNSFDQRHSIEGGLQVVAEDAHLSPSASQNSAGSKNRSVERTKSMMSISEISRSSNRQSTESVKQISDALSFDSKGFDIDTNEDNFDTVVAAESVVVDVSDVLQDVQSADDCLIAARGGIESIINIPAEESSATVPAAELTLRFFTSYGSIKACIADAVSNLQKAADKVSDKLVRSSFADAGLPLQDYDPTASMNSSVKKSRRRKDIDYQELNQELGKSQAQLIKAEEKIAIMAGQLKANETAQEEHKLRLQAAQIKVEMMQRDLERSYSQKADNRIQTNSLPTLSLGSPSKHPIVEQIIDMWARLSIPLVHRSIFYGCPSIFRGIMNKDHSAIETEYRRLALLFQQHESENNTPVKGGLSPTGKLSRQNSTYVAGHSYRLATGLVKEKEWLVKQMAKIPLRDREIIYKNWNITKETRHRKQRLISMVWNVRGRERQSAGLVLHLLLEASEEMPLLAPKTSMMESFYLVARQ